MDQYERLAISELAIWQKQMLRRPTLVNRLSKKVQTKINKWIPEKVHAAITATIKQMIRAVLFGATHTTSKLLVDKSLESRETIIKKRIKNYKNTAAVEGGITGAGGILLGLADFPILLGIKIKLLFDIASMYGFDITNYKERIYILHIFELAFSSHEHRKQVYLKMLDWDNKIKEIPE
ncbi:MAG: EcsC family protein, partial [Ginsengibacter sp.]